MGFPTYCAPDSKPVTKKSLIMHTRANINYLENHRLPSVDLNNKKLKNMNLLPWDELILPLCNLPTARRWQGIFIKGKALGSKSLDSNPNSSLIRRLWSSSFTSSCLSSFIYKNDHRNNTQFMRLFWKLNKIMSLNHLESACFTVRTQ